jgi:hypothetical protein
VAWSLLPSIGGTGFEAISCATSTFCKAADSSSTTVQLWNGVGWAAEATAPPAWAAPVGIDDVSCPAVTFCAAQGFLDYQGQERALTQLWF